MVEPQRLKRSARNFVPDPQEAPEACHRIWQVQYCSVQSCTMTTSGEEPGSCTISLPCMIRLECRHDVFHALGDARDRRDGERVSFLTNSPHIARRVEGPKRREDLDSEICEGLRQQVGGVGHTSATMHMTSGTLDPQILKRRSRRSEGGQIVQELNSIREGKYWGDAKGGWLATRCVRTSPRASAGKRRGRTPSRQAWRTRTRELPSVRT